MRIYYNLRISRHKVFEGLARRGKTSTGWFFGFKLHFPWAGYKPSPLGGIASAGITG